MRLANIGSLFPSTTSGKNQYTKAESTVARQLNTEGERCLLSSNFIVCDIKCVLEFQHIIFASLRTNAFTMRR